MSRTTQEVIRQLLLNAQDHGDIEGDIFPELVQNDMEKFAVPETGAEGLADAGDRAQLLTVLPVQLHQIQVVVGEGGVAQKRRQDIDVLLGKRRVRLLAGEGEDPEDVVDPLERHAEERLG